MRGIHRWPVNSSHIGPVTRKMFPFDNVIMSCINIWHQHIEAEWRLSASVNLATIDSYNSLSLVRRYAITWTNVGALLTKVLKPNYSNILDNSKQCSYTNVLEVSVKWPPFYLSLNDLSPTCYTPSTQHVVICCIHIRERLIQWPC